MKKDNGITLVEVVIVVVVLAFLIIMIWTGSILAPKFKEVSEDNDIEDINITNENDMVYHVEEEIYNESEAVKDLYSKFPANNET